MSDESIDPDCIENYYAIVPFGGENAGAPGPYPEVESDTEPAPAHHNMRRRVGMFTWSCPEIYAPLLAERRARKYLKPADLSKPALWARITAAAGVPLERGIIVQEPHARRNSAGERETHYHVCFKAAAVVKPRTMEKEMSQFGVYGRVSFHLDSFAESVEYCQCESAKKPPSDIDPDPFCIGFHADEIPSILEELPPQKCARMRLTPAEFQTIIVDNACKTAVDAWTLARQLQQKHNDTLYNTLWDVPDVPAAIKKVWDTYNLTSSLQGETWWCSKAPFPLSDYTVPEGVRQWMRELKHTHTLVLGGKAGAGKSSFACALLAADYYFFSDLESLNSVAIDTAACNGVVFDETELDGVHVNDAKKVLDVKFTRVVTARYKKGVIPAGVPRIFTTNVSELAYFLPKPRNSDDKEAMERRIKWVTVSGPLRR